jgi:hypothetical protein
MNDRRITTFLIVNGPVWLFFLLALGIGFVEIMYFAHLKIWIKIGLGIVCWQMVCACVMLLIDYPRKLRLLERFVTSPNITSNPKRLLKPLRQTICGCFLAWAIEMNLR